MVAGSQEVTERVTLLIAEQRHAEAVRACRRALLSYPDRAEIRLLLGEALLALERHDEARVEMIALTRRQPGLATAHRLLGEAYLRDGRAAQAVEALERARRLDPADPATEPLLARAASLDAPASTTIERWFADDAAPTEETALPEWVEEKTPAPATGPALMVEQPSIQVDPSLTAEATHVLRPDTAPSGPPIGARPGAASGASPRGEPVPSPPDSQPPTVSARYPSPQRRPGPRLHTEELDLTALPDDELDSESAPLDEEFPAVHLVPDELSSQRTNTHRRREPLPIRARPARVELPAPSTPPRAAPPSRPPPSRLPAAALPRASVRPASAPPPPRSASVRPPSPSFAPPPGPEPRPSMRPAPSAAPRVPPPSASMEDAPTAQTRAARPRWLLPALGGGLGLLLLVVTTLFALGAWLDGRARDAIRESARAASDSGARADVDAVVGRILEHDPEDPELAALYARQLAVLSFEHGEPRTDAVDAILIRFPTRSPDARIAAAFAHLARGRASAALVELSGLTAEGEQIAEAFRARAFATLALGRGPEAEESARQAASLRPSSPRHLALHALSLHQLGDAPGALRRLAAVPDGESSATVRALRARVLQDAGEASRALADAAAVLGPLAAGATPAQRGWAHLVRARYALGEGDSSTALAEARAAREHLPPADEDFSLRLVEALLRAGAPDEARVELGRWPDPPMERGKRALLAAEVGLALDDLDAVEQALAEASAGPRATLTRARLLEARGRAGDARPLYEGLTGEPGPEGRRARIRLAALALAAGEPARASALLDPLASGPDELEVVPLLVRAYLAEGRTEPARERIDGALARRPDAPELLAARGAVLLAQGRAAEALAVLQRAVGARPSDAELHLDLGDAALRAGELEAARAAFEAALRLRPEAPRASLGLARLALSRGDFDGALARLGAVERSGREPLAAARLGAEVRVRRGDGAAALTVVEPLAARHDDAELWTSLGMLQAQAELDRDAGRSFGRALRRDRDYPEASLGQAMIDLRRGDLGGARRAVDHAEAQGRRRALGPRFAARLAVARGRLHFEGGSFDAAVRLAQEALGHDPESGPAHLLLANVAIERGESPVDSLRLAVAAQAPPPEALGRLVSRLPVGEEACRLGRRYLEVAPGGYDASAVREVAARCR